MKRRLFICIIIRIYLFYKVITFDLLLYSTALFLLVSLRYIVYFIFVLHFPPRVAEFKTKKNAFRRSFNYSIAAGIIAQFKRWVIQLFQKT